MQYRAMTKAVLNTLPRKLPISHKLRQKAICYLQLDVCACFNQQFLLSNSKFGVPPFIPAHAKWREAQFCIKL